WTTRFNTLPQIVRSRFVHEERIDRWQSTSPIEVRESRLARSAACSTSFFAPPPARPAAASGWVWRSAAALSKHTAAESRSQIAPPAARYSPLRSLSPTPLPPSTRQADRERYNLSHGFRGAQTECFSASSRRRAIPRTPCDCRPEDDHPCHRR